MQTIESPTRAHDDREVVIDKPSVDSMTSSSVKERDDSNVQGQTEMAHKTISAAENQVVQNDDSPTSDSSTYLMGGTSNASGVALATATDGATGSGGDQPDQDGQSEASENPSSQTAPADSDLPVELEAPKKKKKRKARPGKTIRAVTGFEGRLMNL